jgi:transposase
VVPPLQTRRDPWEYDTELYKRRNEIERLFGRIKRFRRVFTRYDKTDLPSSPHVPHAACNRWDGDALPGAVARLRPVVPPLQTRRDPWEYDTELYKRRNEIERLFGRIKRFRRVFTRYDKTDLMFSAFVTVAFIADQLR